MAWIFFREKIILLSLKNTLVYDKNVALFSAEGQTHREECKHWSYTEYFKKVSTEKCSLDSFSLFSISLAFCQELFDWLTEQPVSLCWRRIPSNPRGPYYGFVLLLCRQSRAESTAVYSRNMSFHCLQCNWEWTARQDRGRLGTKNYLVPFILLYT